MNCQNCEQYLSAFVDRELDGAASLMVQRHIAHCPSCMAELECLRATKALMSALPSAEPDEMSFVRVRNAVLASREKPSFNQRLVSGMAVAAVCAIGLAVVTSRRVSNNVVENSGPGFVSQDEVYMASSDPSASHVPVFNASINSD